MRFSIKWLLGAVACAAIACSSMVYASDVWATILACIAFFATVAAATLAYVGGGARRAYAAGFAIASLLGFAVHGMEDFGPTLLSPAFNAVTGALTNRFPSVETNVIGYISRVQGTSLPLDAPMQVINRTENEVWCRFTEALDTTPPNNFPQGFIGNRHPGSIFRVPAKELQGAPPRQTVRAVVSLNAQLLLSFLGGVLGLWLWRREELARKAD